VDIRPFLDQYSGQYDYILGIDCVSQKIYMVILEKSKSNGSRYLSALQVTDSEFSMKIDPILSNFEIDKK
jgi:activator of 2-hydroxyglutaryl-CoA dehydratase